MRQDVGFPTAYAFYHRNGGRRSFPFTFSHYRQLERGKHLPRPQWLPLLMNFLRLPSADMGQREFIMSFLRDLFVTEENFQSLVMPLMQEPVQKGPKRRESNRRPRERAYDLTPEQYKAVAADPATYWVFECLINNRGALSADDLTATIGLPQDHIEAGLRSLVAHRLAAKTGNRSYRCARPGTRHIFPCDFPGAEKERGKIARYIDGMIERSGSVLRESGIMLRTEESAVRRALAALRNAMDSAVSGSATGKEEGSGLFILQLHARKAFGF